MSTMSLAQSERRRRAVSETLAFTILALSAAFIVVAVIAVIGYIVVRGAGAISWEFLTAMPRTRGMAGGLLPAIVGSFYLMLGTVVVALPVGMLAAVYLTEYAPPGWLTRAINLSIVNLAGVPSIVYGMFGLGLFALGLGMGPSIMAASLTLACQALAMVITSSREALLAVPRGYREAGLALGATRWQTVRHVVLPGAMPGILTGVVLAVGRAAGETAPILAVGAAFMLPRLPQSPLDQFMALPYHLYIVSTQVPGMPDVRKWAVALVLIVLVLAFNSAAIILRLRLRQGRHT